MSEAIDNIHRDDAVKLICSHMKYSPEKDRSSVRCLRQNGV